MNNTKCVGKTVFVYFFPVLPQKTQKLLNIHKSTVKGAGKVLVNIPKSVKYVF